MARRLLLPAILFSMAWPGVTGAQGAAGTARPAPRDARFAAPVMVLAGERPMGARRLYPSPVLHDMNGDGRADLVLGDLWGRVTVSTRLDGDGPARFGPEEPLLARDGAQLDFQNW
jgi:hypothetical protein